MASKSASKGAVDPKKDTGPPDLSQHTDIIDPATFEQILEMDDDDEREFSKEIVNGFFIQAEQTFEKMDEALVDKDLGELSQLGHFLKGSSATLGLTKVKDACEKIQHYGAGKDDTGTHSDTKENCLKNIRVTLRDVKEDYEEVKVILKRFFGEEPDKDDDLNKSKEGKKSSQS